MRQRRLSKREREWAERIDGAEVKIGRYGPSDGLNWIRVRLSDRPLELKAAE